MPKQASAKRMHGEINQRNLLEFCNILVKLYKKLHFTEFHSLLKNNFEEKSYVLPLFLMGN